MQLVHKFARAGHICTWASIKYFSLFAVNNIWMQHTKRGHFAGGVNLDLRKNCHSAFTTFYKSEKPLMGH